MDKVYIDSRSGKSIRSGGSCSRGFGGFESTFNLDFNTLTTAYVVRH